MRQIDNPCISRDRGESDGDESDHNSSDDEYEEMIAEYGLDDAMEWWKGTESSDDCGSP